MTRRDLLKGAAGFLGLLAAPGGVGDHVRAATAPEAICEYKSVCEFEPGLRWSWNTDPPLPAQWGAVLETRKSPGLVLVTE